MFLVIMSKTNRILLLLCLVVSCNRAQNPSVVTTSPDSTNFADIHNHYAGKLSGTWYRNVLGSRATLIFEPISPDRVQFSITALSGANTGQIDGFLTVDGTRASYKTESAELGNCMLVFDGSIEGSIRIEQEGCSGYTGAGVVFLGLYDRNWSPDESLALATLEERFGGDVTQAIQFLAGSDFDILAASLQLENAVDSGDAFSEVTEFYTRGLRGTITSCIAVNSESGEVWVAYVRDKKLLHTGDLERAPVGFQQWINDMLESYGLELVHKPDPI